MAIIFHDTFTDTPGTLLTAHFPEVGPGWIKDFTARSFQDGATIDMEIDATGTKATPVGNVSNRRNARIGMIADTGTGATEYQITCTLDETTTDRDAPFYLTARYRNDGDGSDGYFVGGFAPNGGGEGNNGVFMFRLNGTNIRYLAFNRNIGLTAGDTLKFVVTDPLKQFYINGNLVLSTVDNGLPDQGFPGFAYGNFISTFENVDLQPNLLDFTVDTTITGEETKPEVPITRVSTGSDSQIQLFKWEGLNETNRGAPFINPRLTRKSMQVVGSFAGGIVEMQATSLPPVGVESFTGQFVTLEDQLGLPVALMENGVIDRLNHAFAYRPVVLSGSGVNLTVYLLSVED